MKKLKTIFYFIGFFTILLCLVFWLVFNSYTGWRLVTKLENFQFPNYIVLQKTFYNFDFTKALLKRGYKKNYESINIELSAEDIKHFQDYYFNQISGDTFFLDDNDNNWRKAKVIFFTDDSRKVKIKIHGTAPLVQNSLGLYDHMRYRLSGVINKNDIDISRAAYGLKLKISSSDSYVDGVRRVNLISPLDDWDSSTIAMNKYISSIGVITTNSKIIKLYINGREVGPYQFEEPVAKERLERNYQITNYAILKNNDDWNKGLGINHISSTDFSSNDMEVSGELETSKIAVAQLKRLINAVNTNDIETVNSLIDINDAAKVSALIKLMGTNHPIAGDNLKYIYDLARGQFKFQFRLEGEINKLLKASPIQFEDNLQYPLNKVIKFMMTQDQFINLRDEYLNKFVLDQEAIEQYIFDEWETNKLLLNNSRFPTKLMEHKYKRNLDALNFNISIIKQYLEYTKIYSTIHEDNDNISLEILHDSYTDSLLNQIDYCNGTSQKFDNPILLNKAHYNSNDIILDSALTKIAIKSSCVSKINLRKKISTNEIPAKHIYINTSKNISNSQLVNNLDQFKGMVTFQNDKNGKETIKILPGVFEIKESIIFPKNISVILSPGVTLLLHPKVSILVQGDLYAKGNLKNNIVIKSKEELPFGTFAVLGDETTLAKIELEHFILGNGSEDIINGIYFSSQLSAHYADVIIDNTTFENSFSDDGLNIKFGKVNITNSKFINNSADQIDLDYVHGVVSNNNFFSDIRSDKPLTDGLDVSGSSIHVYSNIFRNMSDKGLSIGENSSILIDTNIFINNNIGAAVKDSSQACFYNNKFNENEKNIFVYIKKKMYAMPEIFSTQPLSYLFQENDLPVKSLDSSQCQHAVFLRGFDDTNK